MLELLAAEQSWLLTPEQVFAAAGCLAPIVAGWIRMELTTRRCHDRINKLERRARRNSRELRRIRRRRTGVPGFGGSPPAGNCPPPSM